MNAEAEITSAIERVKQTGQKEPSIMKPFEHDARFNMLLLYIRKTSGERKVTECYSIPGSSAKKNELAEGGYWGENWRWINPSYSQKRWVNMRIMAGRLEQMLRRFAVLEYKLEVHMNTLDDLVHRM